MSLILNRNNTNFLYELFNTLKTLKPTQPYDFLTYYQYLTHEYFTKMSTGTRGLLIYHTMGMGKTLLAVAIAMTTIGIDDVNSENNNNIFDPIILSSLSLHSNFIKDIKFYIKLRTTNDPTFKLGILPDDELTKWINKKFKFVTLKASNMLKQLSHAATFDDVLDMDLDNKLNDLLNLETIDGKLLIVDEAHNLFRAITNGSKNAIRLYELIMKSTNIRLLFLTGTPIAKNPFELVPAFNMLGGYYKGNDENNLLPEKYTDFIKYFVDENTNSIKNKNKFQNRIQGMVSYISHTSNIGLRSDMTVDNKNINVNIDDNKNDNKNTKQTYPEIGDFPTELSLIIRPTYMTDKQYMAYVLAREKEKNESSKLQKFEKMQTDPMMIPGKGATSTYRIRSRQISNYYAEGITHSMPINTIPLDKTTSPKFEAMLKDINASPGITMIFSQLLQMSGLSVFARYLLHEGFNKYGNEKINNITNKKSKTFAFISGDMSNEERERVRAILNSPKNAHGEIISIILISEAGAEGLDLKNIRTVLFMEPQWTDLKFNQVKFRAIRKGSHDLLLPEERNVQIILYLALAPKSIATVTEQTLIEYRSDKKPLPLDATTDVVIWINSKRNDKLINSFTEALQEVSIECYVNGYNNCRMCNPTNTTLFEWNLRRDMSQGDPCNQLEKKSRALNKIIINTNTYYWEPNDKSPFKFSIYYYDTIINSYKQMTEDDIRFLEIIEVLENK